MDNSSEEESDDFIFQQDGGATALEPQGYTGLPEDGA